MPIRRRRAAGASREERSRNVVPASTAPENLRGERAERVNPPAEELYAKKWKIFGVMMIGWAMALLDVSIVNIAIPELQRDLDANTDTVTWVINAYNIAFAVTLVTMGRLADQFGRRRFFIGGMALFTLGSALCAAAWSIDSLIFFRAIQGIGAGTLAPLGFAMTVLVFPPAERGKGLATIAIVALVSSALGPVLGGAILEITTWHWIFLINLPFGILGIVLARRIWPETYDLSAVRRQPDWLGMGLLTLAVFSLTFALAEANARGWDDALILFLLQGSVLLAGAFYLSQRYGRWPMITPALMKNRQFTGANATMVLFAAGAFGALFLLSLVFQNLWGYDYWEAALALLPVPITGMLVWPLIGKGADTRPPRQVAVPALLVMAVGLVWFSFVPSTSESWWDYLIVLPGLTMIGVGLGIVFPATNVGAMGAVSGQELGLASGIVNTARQLGAAIGIALLVATIITAAGYTLEYAKEDIVDANDQAELPPEMALGLGMRAFADYSGTSHAERYDPGPGFDEIAARETAGAARDAYGWGFRVAALAVLLAVPFARTMTRPPAAARAADQAAQSARAAAAGEPPGGSRAESPGGSRAEPAPAATADATPQRREMEARIGELEASLEGLRSQLDEPAATQPPRSVAGDPANGNAPDSAPVSLSAPVSAPESASASARDSAPAPGPDSAPTPDSAPVSAPDSAPATDAGPRERRRWRRSRRS